MSGYHKTYKGDCLDIIPTLGAVDLVIADPPYEQPDLINKAIKACHKVCPSGPLFFFMYAEALRSLENAPDQVLFWLKPPSTKNTVRRYSRFVEVIAAYQLDKSPFNQNTFWMSRSGMFTDTLTHKPTHPFEKPVSLHEKLLAVNANPNDWVLDPFAGSESVRRAAENLRLNSVSIELGVT